MTHGSRERDAVPGGPSDTTGWDHLAAGRWQAARAAFIAELRDEESAEAHEALSWAAWWLDDAATVFASRERAFQLYRERGERGGAARMATWIAADALDFHAAAAVASGWLRRARRLLEPLEPGPDHGWLAFHEGYIAAGSDAVRAIALARGAAEIGRTFEVPDLEMLGLALEGSVLVSAADVERGMACLDEAAATALAGESAIPISRAWACCFLVSACETVRDYTRAFEWCDRIADFAERYGSRYMLAFCRAHYGAVSLWRGQWDRAEAELQAAVSSYQRSRPSYVPGVRAHLAELRRRQGRWADADALLENAAGREAVLCRARLAIDRGDPLRAAETVERWLRRAPDGSRLLRVPALELLVRARAARGDTAAAAAALEAMLDVSRDIATGPTRAAAALADGLLRAARADHEGARAALETAVDLFEQSGAPYEAACARIDLATSLGVLGRAAAAAREVDAGIAAFTALGAEADVRHARRLLDAPHADRRGAAITRRERDVLSLLSSGLTNRQIADRLCVSEHTVHRHVANILRKLDLPSRAAAAAWAVQAGVAAPAAP